MDYCSDFIDGIRRQTDRGFDVLFMNDAVDDLPALPDRTVVLQATGTPFRNRLQTIRYAMENGYDYLCWLDLDDSMPENRLERIRALLSSDRTADLLIHDLWIMDQNGVRTGERFIGSYREKIGLEDLLFYNCAGFGNTVARVEALRPVYGIAQDLAEDPEAADWWLFVTLLLQGGSARYTDEALYDYRIYTGNMSGGSREAAAVQKRVGIILHHYRLLGSMLDDGLSPEQKEQKDIYIQRLEEMKQDPGRFQVRDRSGCLWWEDIYRAAGTNKE